MSKRENNKNSAKVGIALVGIVIAGFLLLNSAFHFVDLGFFGGKDNPAVNKDRQILVIDLDTGKAVMATKGPDQTFPLTNESGSKSLYEAYVCEEDKIIFPAKPGRMIQISPKTGSTMTGAASEKHKGYDVAIPDNFPDI